MTVFLPVPLYLCALWLWRQPWPGDIVRPPPAAWPSRYKIAPSHSTVSQSQTSARERDRIARPPITVDTEYNVSVVSVEGRPASLAWPIAAGDNGPCALLHRLTHLTHIDTLDTRL